MTRKGAMVDIRRGIAQSSSAYMVSAYFDGENEYARGNIRVNSGAYVAAGDYVVVHSDAEGDAWVNEILPSTAFPKMAVDGNRGRILVGTGTAEPQDSGSSGYAIISNGSGSPVTWGTPWINPYTTTRTDGATSDVWTKIASGSLTGANYQSLGAVFVQQTNLNSQNNQPRGVIRWNIRAKNPYTQDPDVYFDISNTLGLNYDDVRCIVTSTAGPVVYEIYIRLTSTWTEYWVTPIYLGGDNPPVCHSAQSLLAVGSLPAGTVFYAMDWDGYQIHSQKAWMGGGTVTVSASGYVKNSQRFISIGQGRHLYDNLGNAYHQINIPTSGTVTGIGVADKTATVDGVQLAVWESLWYIPTSAQFRVYAYNTYYVPPKDWVCVAVRNGDTNKFLLCNGMVLGLGESQTYGDATPALQAHIAAADPHTGYVLESAHGNTGDVHTQYQLESEKGVANGYASLGASAYVPTTQLGSGTAGSTNYLRGDQSWATPAIYAGATYVVGDTDITSSGANGTEKTIAWNSTAGISSLVMPRNGTLVGISIRVSSARTSGSIQARVYNFDTSTFLTLATALNSTDTQESYAAAAIGSSGNTFTAGNRLQVKTVVTSATYAPIDANVHIAVYVVFDM